MSVETVGKVAGIDRSPLAGWRVLRTDDVECAYDTISSTFKEHTFKTAKKSRVSDTKLHHLGFGDVSINYIQYGVDITVDADFLEEFFLVHMPVRGESNVWLGNEQYHLTGHSAIICPPNVRSKFQWQGDCGVLAVKIAKSSLLDYIGETHEIRLPDQFAFSPEMTSDSGAFCSWRNLIHYIITEAENANSLINRPGVGEELKSLLFSCLVNSQPHNLQEVIAGRSATAAPRHVRLAEEYARANIAARITISELARCANVSERTLFNGFQDFRQTTPMKFINDLRLDQIRRDLQQSSETESIAEISSRWGFSHQGAFTKAYRERFGETASQTRRNSMAAN